MAKKLELWLEAKPYVITQRHGIFNPAYVQFGFNQHNGTDYRLGADRSLYGNVPDAGLKVLEVNYQPNGGGHYILTRTVDEWEVLGATCHVEFTFMHLEQPLVKAGDTILLGQKFAVADNTGFSTGPHTHRRARRIKLSSTNPDIYSMVDMTPNNNYSFDDQPLYNGFYAVDYKTVLSLHFQIIQILTAFLSKYQKKVGQDNIT